MISIVTSFNLQYIQKIKKKGGENMNRFLEEATAMKSEIIANRRYIHQHAELGFELPDTVAYVMQKLKEYGYEPAFIGGGVVCVCGSGGKTIMLRADMDALPQKEVSGLEFSCKSGTACHSCGHDCHTAMLLGAAKLLKEHEGELAGTVKLVFQPGEETLRGAKTLIEAGVLENPKVDAAMGLHMNFGPCGPHNLEVGTLVYAMSMSSADEFEVIVNGKTAHGGSPFAGISALSAAANIVTAVQQLASLEVPCDEATVISFGSFNSGSASNIIPDEAVLTGSIRAFSRENRERVKKRFVELCKQVAGNWNAQCEVKFVNEVGPNVNAAVLTEEMIQYCNEVMKRVDLIPPIKGSEDFANYGEYIPTFFANICAGGLKEGYNYAMHNPHATLDEEALPYGSAVMVNCAMKWLENHSK